MEAIDTAWFFYINQMDLPNWIETILIAFRNPNTWISLYIILIVGLIYFLKRNGIIIVIMAMATTGMTDFTNSSLLKYAFERPRPCHQFSEDDRLVLRINCGSGYSFPSSHAANHFALAHFLVLIAGAGRRIYFSWLYLWAIGVGFAQIYVGVHFPSDIIGGMIWGAIISIAMYRLTNTIISFLDKKQSKP